MAEAPKEIKVKVTAEETPQPTKPARSRRKPAAQPEQTGVIAMSLGQKLVAIMAEMQEVEKGGWNANQKYKFVQEVDVVNAVRPLLAKYHVMVHQTVFCTPDGMPMVTKSEDGRITTIVYEMQLIDADTGTVWPKSIIVQDGFDTGDKGPNKTLTGANKWFHMRTWQIGAGTTEEAEGDEATDKQSAAAAAKSGPRRITRGKQEGVERGGKSNIATRAQAQEIGRLVRELGLDQEAFVNLGRKVVNSEPAENQTASQWLATLTSDQAAAIIAALTAKPVDADVESVDGVVPEGTTEEQPTSSKPVTIV